MQFQVISRIFFGFFSIVIVDLPKDNFKILAP